MGRPGEWTELCRLLEDDESVAEGVEEALLGGGDPWQALLDGLDDAGALAYLRTDDTGMELTDALEQLPRVVAAQPDLGRATDTDDLPAATGLADRLLAEDALRILRLVEDDDSWPLVVVPADRVDPILRLAERLGQRVERTA